ncbi:MAG: IspD/TarI family cytidylyltransferase, partial [Janthinobacterium lividum]
MLAAVPKQYLMLAGEPMLRHVVATFAAAACIDQVFVVVSAGDAWVETALAGLAEQPDGRVRILRCGGASRRDSVLNALDAIEALGAGVADDDWMLVHDAARPGLTVAMIDHLVNALEDDPVGGLLALPVVDTLKRGGAGERVASTVERTGLWAAQTPQMFRHRLLCQALRRHEQVTDEAGAMEADGL